MEAAALLEFQALVERVGGRQRLLLVGEAASGGAEGEKALPAAAAAAAAADRAMLETFARDLFAEPEKGADDDAAAGEPPRRVARRRRVRVRVVGGCCGGGGRWLLCRPQLVLVLVRARSLQRRRERLRLREILRDVRGRLLPESGAPVAVVGVLVGGGAPPPPPPSTPPDCGAWDSQKQQRDPDSERAAELDAAAAAARLQLLRELLQQGFGGANRRPGLQDTRQAATYTPGTGAQDVREAACTALRAALKAAAAAAADVPEPKKACLPAFLQCISWGRRRRRRRTCHRSKTANSFHEDGLQDLEEVMALTNMASNGTCGEACGMAGGEMPALG